MFQLERTQNCSSECMWAAVDNLGVDVPPLFTVLEHMHAAMCSLLQFPPAPK